MHVKPTETTVPHISTKEISSFKVPTPPSHLQLHFEKLISTINGQKANLLKTQKNSTNLFNSLLQKAFKGELV